MVGVAQRVVLLLSEGLEGRKRGEMEDGGRLKPRGKRGLLGKRPELFLWIHLQKPSETRSTDLFVPLSGPHCEAGVTLWPSKLSLINQIHQCVLVCSIHTCIDFYLSALTAVPSHGEPAVLSGAQDVPVCTLRPCVYWVWADDFTLPPPLSAGQERLLQTDGHVWCQLAAGDGLQQVGTTVIIHCPWIYAGSNDPAASVI